MRTIPLLLITVLASLAVWTPAAAAVTHTSTEGRVTATLSYDQPADEPYQARNLHLTIVRAGVTRVDTDLIVGRCVEPLCLPTGLRPTVDAEASEVLTRDLDDNGEPEVLVELQTGGPICCARLLVYSLRDGAYRRSVRNTANAGTLVRDLGRDRKVELISQDDRFRSRFAHFSLSWLPVQVLRFRGGSFQDVSRRFPAQLQSDARQALSFARGLCSDGSTTETLGIYAGWAWDQYRLGRAQAALATLRTEDSRGCLRGNRVTPFLPKLDAILRVYLRSTPA